jgi:hypothetical protein
MRGWRPGKGGLPPPSAAVRPHSPPREYFGNDEVQGIRARVDGGRG